MAAVIIGQQPTARSVHPAQPSLGGQAHRRLRVAVRDHRLQPFGVRALAHQVDAVIRRQLDYMDAVTWFDYSTTPPTLNIKRRSGQLITRMPLQ